jgi:poly(A) polymerase Pap1
MKLMSFVSPNSHTPATIVRTFFEYYSTFNWSQNSVLDPGLEVQKGTNIERSTREAIVIQALHLPAARSNVAASCTRLSALTISSEFALAKTLLEQEEWGTCLGTSESGVSQFLSNYGAYVKITVEAWDVDEDGIDRARDIVGGVESRVVRLLVEMGRIGGLEARIWPERFWALDEARRGGVDGLKGYYLVGVRAKEESDEMRKVISGKVVALVRAFEETIRHAVNPYEGNAWIGADVVSKNKVAELRLAVDRRDWGRGL